MRDLPGDPGVKTVASNAGVESLIPGQEAKIPDVSYPKVKTQIKSNIVMNSIV